MRRFKLLLRIGGIIVLAVGVKFLPLGYGHRPKRDLSAFNNIVDMGPFTKMGLLLAGAGLFAFIVSFVLPRGLDDDDY